MKFNPYCNRLSMSNDTYSGNELPSCEFCNRFNACKREYIDMMADASDNQFLDRDVYRGVFLGLISSKYGHKTKLKKLHNELEFIKIKSNDIEKIRALFKTVNDH